MFLVFFGFKKYVLKNTVFGGGNKLVHVLGTWFLGPKKNIVLVEVAGEVLVLGISQENITLLNSFTSEEKIEEIGEKSDTDDNETKVMKLIKEDEGDGIYYDDLAIKISAEGIDNPMLDEILDSLTDQGLVFQPRFNHYKEA